MSATMLDSFDSPMLDYPNDHDIPMQNNSDPWYQGDEHNMEDEAHDNGSHVSIEVDMEGFEEDGNPEYEMVDTEVTYENQSHEPIDIELYDASSRPSPYHQIIPLPEDNLQVPEITTTDSLLASPKPMTPIPLSPKRSMEENTMAASPLPFSDDVEQTFVLEENKPAHLEAPSSLENAANVEKDGHADSSAGDEAQPEPTVVEVNHIPAGDGIPAVLVDQDNVEGAIPVIKSTSPHQEVHEESQHEPPSEHEVDRSYHDERTLVPESEQPHELVREDKVDHHKNEGQVDDEEHVGQYDHASSAASSGDPHEISEGVYIDPPPPVLMTFTSEAPPVSLFNSASDSPSTSASPEPIVILVHQPTLYYEPLSSVFEALRQEEYLHNIPDLLDGEIALNVYDLDLIISEDYTFSHELTLHDLNVLHDGLNKVGPLRVQLKRVGPRFLDKYHALQQQVQQLELSISQPSGHAEDSNENQDQNAQSNHTINEIDSHQDSHTSHPEEGMAQPVVEQERYDDQTDNQPEHLAEEEIPPPPDDDDDEDLAPEPEAEHVPTGQNDDVTNQVDLAEGENQEVTNVEEANNELDGSDTDNPASGDAQNEDYEQEQQPEDSNEVVQDSNNEGPVKQISQILEIDAKNQSEPAEVHSNNVDDEVAPLTENPDESNLDFEEVFDDEESATLSNEGLSEHEHDGGVDDAQLGYDEDAEGEEWDETFEVNDDPAGTNYQVEPSHEDPINKLRRVQSFGGSKRSISEAELEDFDDGETTLSASPGSKRLRTE